MRCSWPPQAASTANGCTKMTDKAALRKAIRALYPGQAARDAESAHLCRHILGSDEYRRARVIGGYMPLLREADITLVLQDILATGRTLALPLCGDAPHMTLRRVTSLDELVPGPYGLLEPAPTAPLIDPDRIELLLTPLEGIDPTGMRLGKGGGYYDCLLSGHEIPTLGCALTWQWTSCVPADAWDKPLNTCADMHGIHTFMKEGTHDGNQEEKASKD